MKKHILSLILLIVFNAASAQSVAPQEVTDATISSVKKELARTSFMTYNKKEKAATNNFDLSEYYQNLNGKWKFKHVADVSQRIDNFYDVNFDDSSWGEIDVPGNWEMMGASKASFADSLYEFSTINPTPPLLPDKMPMAMYRTTFKVPYIWEERQIFLNIGAIKSGSVIYINGQKVGYAEDSKTAAEFDITNYVKEGYNTLAIETYRWSTGSFLESQKGWRLSGIERGVYLVTQPKIRIRDFLVHTTLNPELTDGLLELGVVIKSHYLNPKEVRVFYDLIDPEGKTVSYESKMTKLRLRLEDTVYFSIPVYEVKKWSAETPNLYSILLKVQRENRFTEFVSAKIGFRSIDFSGDKLLINGAPVIIKGVNYTEHHPNKGHVVDEELLRTDMQIMKKLGVNAIRAKGYPQQPLFYNLCDEYGFYVVSEANISSHAMGYDLNKGGTLGNNILFVNSHIERVMNMYESVKSHPSVIMLSMGTESGNGYNFYKAFQRIKASERIRPVVYDGAGLEWNSDLYFGAAPSTTELMQLANKSNETPYIFSSIEANSDLEQTWDIILNSPYLQGGFISDYSPQALRSADGKWVYGTDENNYLVTMEREMCPAAEAVAKLFEPLTISSENISQGVLQIKNNLDFIKLFDITYEVVSSDKVIINAVTELLVNPKTETTLTIEPLSIKNYAGSLLNLHFRDRESGTLITSKQIKL